MASGSVDHTSATVSCSSTSSNVSFCFAPASYRKAASAWYIVSFCCMVAIAVSASRRNVSTFLRCTFVLKRGVWLRMRAMSATNKLKSWNFFLSQHCDFEMTKCKRFIPASKASSRTCCLTNMSSFFLRFSSRAAICCNFGSEWGVVKSTDTSRCEFILYLPSGPFFGEILGHAPIGLGPF